MATTVRHESQGDELRLALAMRGGVSLAVWIAGACAEIELLRRSAPGAPGPAAADFYRGLCRTCGYDAVTIDVLAGASAGGLNAVLLATSLAYGADVRGLRDTWLKVADLDPLSVPPEGAASLLNGTAFHDQLHGELEKLLSAAARQATGQDLEEGGGRSVEVVDHLDIVLAATLLDPAPDFVAGDLGVPFVEKRRSACFHFHMADPALSPTSTLPQPLRAAAVPGVARRLSVAARATASFPGAFEPVPVTSTRPASLERQSETAREDDLFGVFSEATADLARPFWVLDGGVLDNIPVARAIDAIAAARAAGPTERWLLFLHPSPSDDANGSSGARKSPVSVRETLTSIGGRETLLEDMAVLERHNAATRRFRVMRDSIANDLLTAAALGAGSEPSSGALAKELAEPTRTRAGSPAAIRRSLVAERAAGLLRDPVAALGGDEFTRDRHRVPTHDWPNGALAIVDAQLRSSEGLASEDPTLELRAVSRTALLLVEWARQREDAIDRSVHRDLERVGHAKHIAYRLAATADLLADRTDLAWVLAAADSPPKNGTPTATKEWVASTLSRMRAILAEPTVVKAAADLVALHRHLLDDLSNHSNAQRDDTARALTTLALALDRALEHPAPLTADAGSRWATVNDELWDVAGRLAIELSEPQRTNANGADQPKPVFALLGALPFTDAASARDLLRLLDNTFLPTATLSTTPPSRIRFARVSAAAKSPVGYLFEKNGGGGQLSVRDKLTGNELFNFAAFLRPSWRANDWMWGRLDAAAHLVELLTEPDRLRQFAPPGPPEQRAAHLAEQVRRAVTSTDSLPDADQASWQEHFERQWNKHAGEVAGELADMFSGRSNKLIVTRLILTARRQWDILREEVPVVVACAELDEARDKPRLAGLAGWVVGRRVRDGLSIPSPAPAADPTAVERDLARWRIGTMSVRDAARTRRIRWLAGDIAANAWDSAWVGWRRAPRAGRFLARLGSAYAIRRIVRSQRGTRLRGR